MIERAKQGAYSILKKSEKYTKTDMIYLAKGGSWLGLGQAISSVSVLIMSLFFANVLPKEVYGNYRFIISLSGVFSALSLNGMGTVIVQGVARGAEGILSDAVKTNLRWGLIIVVAAVSTAIYYFVHGNSIIGFSMLLIGIVLPLNNSYGLFGSYLSGKKNFKLGVIFNSGTQVFTTILLIIIAITTKSVLPLVLAYFVSNTLAILLGYKYVISHFHLNDVKDHTLIPYSKHLSLMNLIFTFAHQLDKILVFHYLGALNLATYSFAQSIPEHIKGWFKSLFGVATPKYATLPDDALRKSIKKKAVQLTALTALVIIAYILSAPLIFKLLFPKYLESVFYSQIYILGLVVVPATSLFFMYFQLKKDTRTMYKLNIVNSVLTIGLTFIFIYKWGLKGAVIENSINWFLFFFANWYYFSKSQPPQNIARSDAATNQSDQMSDFAI